MKRTTMIILGIALIVLAFWYFTGTATATLTMDPTIKNLGEVSQKNGVVSTDFALKNTGTAQVQIQEIQTSCMCTTAQVIMGEKQGQIYGMHGNPSSSITIPSDSSATLRVFYDPNMHKDLRGPVTRMVTLKTNAGTYEVRIKLNQVQ